MLTLLYCLNLLFICSRNQWRSPTAEKIFRSDGYQTKSAGTAASAKIKLNESHILWADKIFVMEHRHRQMMREKFDGVLQGKQIVVLDIADEYRFMDEELIAVLRIAIAPYLHAE